ncbi:MAG: hypothetical protein DRP42_05340 [Tenericutes bacterium]|nr:MAG: hypothetical protein DRP42_05340 [Mycoplasmatota bacterium]
MDVNRKVAHYKRGKNFWIVDEIPVPHPYCVGARHVGHASNNFGGMLSEECIKDGEKNGITCETRGCNLMYKEHEKALIVQIFDKKNLDEVELQDYLKSIVKQAEDEGYVGFVFMER